MNPSFVTAITSRLSMSGFIPPPYPFVEAWPRVFRSADQSRWLTPATVLRFAGGGDSDAGDRWGARPTGVAGAATPQANTLHSGQPRGTYPIELLEEGKLDAEAGDDDDDGEYEYRFVLTEEWRERLVDRSRVESNTGHRHHGHDSGSDGDRRQQDRRSTTRRKSKPAKRQQQQRRQPPSNGTLISGAGNSRAEHLQQELEDAKARELAMRWRHQRTGGVQQSSAAVRRLETALNARFDEFCDAYQPVVWPHASAR